MPWEPPVADPVRAAFDRREDPGRALGEDAEAIASACHAMAVRFHAGGRLIVFGGGAAATDAQHVAVEFVHPVVVGKRALPAISLAEDAPFAERVRLLGEPGDIALGISADGRSPDVLHALRAARELGLCTVALVGGDGGDIAGGRGEPVADHAIVARSGDPCVVKEVHVTAYHILWELVHVFLEHPASLEPEAVR